MKVYFDDDADLEVLRQKTIAIVGYGAQGRAHALNLRDSGCTVILGQRPGPGFDRAVNDQFTPIAIQEAVAEADVVSLLLPDEYHQSVFSEQIRPHLRPGCVVLCCHGFSFHYELVQPPPTNAGALVAPKGAAHMVRTAYEQGRGVPCLIAMGPHADHETFRVALAYAKGLGGTRVGVFETTIAEETETDLFGEQAVLCGGVSHLIKAAFETLVEAGYQPELAYFECLWELKLVVDLLHRGGLAAMRKHISNTAEFGDYTRGPRIVDDRAKQTMREILAEIRSGQFAKEFLDATQGTPSLLQQLRGREQQHPIESAKLSIERLLGKYPQATPH